VTENGLEEIVRFDSEPIVAWRVWMLIMEDSEPVSLRSVSYRIRWKPGRPTRAHCIFNLKPRQAGMTYSWQHAGESAPCLAHTCGVYALKYPAGLAEWGTHYANNMAVRVVGQVSLWGKVLEHELGYRAEYGYPLSFVPPDDPEIGDWLETTYLMEGI
jgi:hypothetical protein